MEQELKLTQHDVKRIELERSAPVLVLTPAFAQALAGVLEVLEDGLREGEPTDIPEGSRKLWLSDTLAGRLAASLRRGVVDLGEATHRHVASYNVVLMHAVVSSMRRNAERSEPGTPEHEEALRVVELAEALAQESEQAARGVKNDS